VRTAEFSLSDIEAEIAGMIAAEKGVASIAADGQEGSGSSASLSPTGAGLTKEPVNSSQSELNAVREEVQVVAHGAKSDAASDPGHVPEAQRESEHESEADRNPDREQVELQERTKQQPEQLPEPQSKSEPQTEQELQQSQLASQPAQQAGPGSEPESELQPGGKTVLPEPEPQPKLQLASKPQHSSRSVTPEASAVPEGVPPSGNGHRRDTPGVAVDGGRNSGPLTFESLVPADLRADLDRATQLEADGKFREALTTYTDCIRRLAPIYKRKSTQIGLHTSNPRSVRASASGARIQSRCHVAGVAAAAFEQKTST
jgi:hypothetical protein